MEVCVRYVALLALLPAPVERDLAPPPGLHMPVHAVVRSVDLPVLEPFVERRIGLVNRLGRLLEPVQLRRLLGPPALPVPLGVLVYGRIREQRAGAEVRRR